MGKKLLLIFSLFAISKSGYAAEHFIKMIADYENMRMYYIPKSLEIKSGDTVTWMNNSEDNHNVISYPDGYPEGAEKLKSPYLTKLNDKWSYTFKKSGTYQYHCQPHVLMGMRGEIIVDKPSKEGEFHKPTAAEISEYKNTMLQLFDVNDFQYLPRYVREKVEEEKVKENKTNKK